ncbi:hypothetical protein TcBrA4_0020840 [Trypanosoma cruzi]|nr:hypothetical protein TcBrA4_0020840 [Trypanosoma cruzi]
MSCLQSAGRVPVCRGVGRRTSISSLLVGKEWRCSSQEEFAAEAVHRRAPNSTAAQPIPEGRDIVPPCLGESQAWDREGTKLFRTDHWQQYENTAKGMIAVFPFAEHFSSWQAAAAIHSACSIPSVVIPVGLSRLPLVWCLGAFPTMWSQWPEVCHTPRREHHSQLHAGQRRHVSVVAPCLPVAGGRPPSLQCGMADVGPSPCKRVEVQWRHAVRVASHVGKRDAAAADLRCLCRDVRQLNLHAAWGDGEVLSCHNGW